MSGQGATSTDLPSSTGTVTARSCTYYGYELRETGGAASGTVVLRVGGASGAIIATLTLAANESIGIDRDHGRICRGGIHATISGSGVISGAVFHS
jgi:hypothetical protein